MKKQIAILTILFFSTFLYSQEIRKGFQISLKGGGTLSNQYGKDASSETFLNGSSPEMFYANHPASKKIKAGINVGGLLDYRFNKRISLGVGVNYVQKGSRINVTSHWNGDMQEMQNVDGTIKWIQNYWTVDIPLKVYFPLKQNELHLLGGLTYGNLINSKEEGDIEILGTKYNYTYDRGANKNELGFLVGIGYNYLLGNKNYLIIDFTWNRSFGNSYGDDLIPAPLRYFNQTFNLAIGYRFDLRKEAK